MDVKGSKSRSASAVETKKKESTLSAVTGAQSPSRRVSQSRQESYGFGSIPVIKPIERHSTTAVEYRRPPMIFLPTYQLDPILRFDTFFVQNVIEAVLDSRLQEHKYCQQESPTLAMRIAGELVNRVKAMHYNRYRIISVVTIGQRRAQSYNNTVSFLWDPDRDVYVDVQRLTNTYFLQVTIFGIYLD